MARGGCTVTDNKLPDSSEQKPKKAIGVWWCSECGLEICNGFVWNGKCVFCAEVHLNPEAAHDRV